MSEGRYIKMPKIIDDRSSLDRTIKIYDSFYNTNLKIDPAKYDIVYGYFVSVCKTKNIAANFTTVLFRISTQTGIDVLELLNELKGAGTSIELNKQITYWLNSIRSKTSLYGISVIPKPVISAARNVVI